MLRRFVDLMDVHADLDRALAEHQEALAGLELDRATDALARYDAAIRAHMGVEEGIVLPLYESLVPGAADAQLYRGEHRKLRLLLDELRDRVARAREETGGERARRRHVIGIFDRESVLKNLLEHHDARERNVLYPALDRAAAPDVRDAALRAIERGEPLASPGALPATTAPPPKAARRIAGVAVGLFLVAVKLADDRVGLAPSPPADALDAAPPDPEVLLGRDALELGARYDDPSPLVRALAEACRDALSGARRVLAPERLLIMVGRGARLEHLGRTLA